MAEGPAPPARITRLGGVGGLKGEGGADGGNGVKELPAEELHLEGDGLTVAAYLNGCAVRLAAHVAVCGGGAVDRILQSELADNCCRAKVK